MIWLLLVITIAILFYYWFIKPQYYWRDRHVKQGIPIPILGDSYRVILKTKSTLENIRDEYNKYPSVRYFGIYEVTIPTLIIRDPELIKQITVKDFDHFQDHRTFMPENVDALWSRNLFALKGEAWRNMRATLSPTFTSSKMKSMFTLMETSAQQYVNYYLEQKQDCIDVDLKDSFSRFANDVIANCAFGVTVDSLKEPKNIFYLKGKEITKMTGVWLKIKFLINLVWPKLAAFFKLGFFSVESGQFFKKLINDAITLREEQHISRPDVINLLMEARKGQLKQENTSDVQDYGFSTVEESYIGRKQIKVEMTDLDMAAQIMIFFLGGFETISTMMSFLCYELALHPEIQERLRQEIDETWKETNGQLTYGTLGKLKYLDMVVTESMRKNPPFISLDRICTKPYTIQPVNSDERPVELKLGQLIMIPIVGIHHDEQYYPNPLKFDPERFSDENKANVMPYTYLPFGAGPRNCIGSRFALMELKTLIYHVLSKFELTVISKTTIPMIYDKNNFHPALEGGFWVGLKQRNLIK